MKRAASQADGRPHHISAIAHMFFADEATEREGAADPVHDLAVAAADGRVAAAALVAEIIQLHADRADGDRVCVAETPAGSVLDLLPSERRDERAPGGARGVRVTAVRTPRETAETGWWWRWRHFGAVTEAQLAAWESAATAPPLALVRSRWRGLVWLAAADTAAHLATLSKLRRLVRVLDPGRLEIVVSPRPESGADAAATAGKILALAPAALGGLPLAVTALPGDDAGESPAWREAALAALLGRMMSPAASARSG